MVRRRLAAAALIAAACVTPSVAPAVAAAVTPATAHVVPQGPPLCCT